MARRRLARGRGRGRAALALVLALALALSLLPAAAFARDAPPRRVMSTNLCADQAVIALLPPSRIASVSWLARDPTLSAAAAAAARLPVNYGGAEEAIAADADLVLTGTYSGQITAALLTRLGAPVMRIPPPRTLKESFAMLETIGAAVGAEARAAEIVAAARARMAAILTSPSPSTPSPSPSSSPSSPSSRPRVAALYPAGWSAAPGGMLDALMRRAGLDNMADSAGVDGLARFTLEGLIAARPDGLILVTSDSSGPALAARLLDHPAIRALTRRRPVITLNDAHIACGGPPAVDALARLTKFRDRLLARRSDGGRGGGGGGDFDGGDNVYGDIDEAP